MTGMQLQIRQLHPLFVGEISGVDAGHPLTPPTVRAIWDAIDRYAVLVLRDQELDDDRQLAFARNFGEIEAPRSAREGIKRRVRPEMSDISNLDENRHLRAADDPRRFDQLGNRLWHTDGSFRRVPAALSMLYAHSVPAMGGETEFADLRAAWDAFPDTAKAEVENLVALHDIAFRAVRSVSPSCCSANAKFCHRSRSAWFASIRAPGARPSTSPHTLRTSSAGPYPKGVCCCAT